MNLFEQSFETSARSDQIIFVPFGVAIGPIKSPFPGLGFEPELSHHGFHPDLRLSKTRALFVESYTVSPESESEPDLVVEVNRKPLTTILGQDALHLLSGKFG